MSARSQENVDTRQASARRDEARALLVTGARSDPAARAPTYGVVSALPEELGSLRSSNPRWSLGIEVHEHDIGTARVLATAGGIGKVAAAHAATVLLAAGVDRALLVVGTCGGLRQRLVPGTLVHCRTAVQTDLAVRAGRENDSDAGLRAAWLALVPGEEAWFLSADRPVLSLWRRLRLARAFAGACVADMETGSVAAVATRARIPWAALRAVTDRATWLGAASFRLNYPIQAGRAADTVRPLIETLERAN